MSYEKIKYIAIKNNNIYITGASNNVRPLYYSKWDYSSIPENERLFELFSAIIDGSYHLENSVNQKIRFAIYKTREFIRNNNIDTYKLFINIPKWEYEYIASLNEIDFVYEGENYSEEYINRKRNIDTIFDKITKEERYNLYLCSKHKVYDEIYNVFIKEYNNYVQNNNKYIIEANGLYVVRLNRGSLRYCYSKNYASKFDYVDAITKAELIKCAFRNWENAKILKVD